MYKLRLIISILLISLLFGCKDKNVNSFSNREIISFDTLGFINDIRLSEIFNDVYFIKLQSGKNSNFTKINKVVFSKRYIFILDLGQSNDLLVFLRDGRFITKLTDLLGEHPELNLPTDLFFNENKSYLTLLNDHNCMDSYYVGQNDSIVFKDRKIIPEKLSPFSIVEYNNGDNFAIISGGETYNLCLADKKFNNSEFFFPSMGPLYTVILNHGLSFSGQNILYQKFLNDTIFRIDHMSVLPYKIFQYDHQVPLDSIFDLSDPIIRQREIARMYKTSFYFENNKSFYLKYVSDDNEFYLIRDQSGAYFHFKRNSLINDFYGTSSFNCIGVDTTTNSYVFSIPAEKLLRYAVAQHTDIQATYIEKIKALNLNENDNEVLIFAKMK